MNNIQNQYRIQTRSLSPNKILIILQNLDQVAPQLQQKSMRINDKTTFLDIKQVISNKMENQEDIELYLQMNQRFTGNLNGQVLNKIKQEKIKTIYYRIVNRNKTQPQNLISNTPSPNFNRKSQESIGQQNPRNLTSKNIISPTQKGNQFEFYHQNNNQGNIVLLQQENQSLRTSLEQLKIHYADYQKQNQEWGNEKKQMSKQIRMNSMKIQDLQQENSSLSELNQTLSNELAILKQNLSELENLELENQQFKDEIKQIQLLSEEMFMEKSFLQEQNSQLLKELQKFNNLQQENQRLILIINDYKEKANFIQQNQIQMKNQFSIKQKNDRNTLQNLEEQQNQQQIWNPPQNLKKSVPSNQDSYNNNLINTCGHAFSFQQLAQIIYNAFLNKQKALCNQCSQPLKSKLCLQDQSLGRNYLEDQNQSDSLNLINFIHQKINSHSQSLAKCKNLHCNFFCIWQNNQQNQERSCCAICLEQSVINPFLPDQVLQEISSAV